MHHFALLAGMFGVPAFLLWIGHRIGDRSPVQRGAFWGGVIGHTLALLVVLVAFHVPPVIWTGELRIVVIFWIMLAGGLAGVLIGSLRGGRRASQGPGRRASQDPRQRG